MLDRLSCIQFGDLLSLLSHGIITAVTQFQAVLYNCSMQKGYTLVVESPSDIKQRYKDTCLVIFKVFVFVDYESVICIISK